MHLRSSVRQYIWDLVCKGIGNDLGKRYVETRDQPGGVRGWGVSVRDHVMS